MSTTTQIKVPDIGDFKDVEVIEVLTAPGSRVKAEDPLITLESDKATLEVPCPRAGIVGEVMVAVGDKVSEGAPILTLEEFAGEDAATDEIPPKTRPIPTGMAQPSGGAREGAAISHASPSVRRLGRELGVDPERVTATGPKGRVLPEDVKRFAEGGAGEGKGVPTEAVPAAGFVPSTSTDTPAVDFSRFGPVQTQPLTRIQRISGANLHRTWSNVPHVTQHDLADITELEAFRQSLREESVRVTLPAFLLKASVAALKAFPAFNASLGPDGESLILKHYYHIGVAVDTPEGLVVPVIRDVDQKGIRELAEELAVTGAKAREKRLTPGDLQGGCFTLSSLGGIGGTGCTPILNAPEVAILGVAKSSIQPVYLDGEFRPRRMLPLSLSYDHRVIDGANGARFTAFLCSLLADIRRLLL
uniref:Dihydrolipoamide acetyltransferase component of pyruvate dehydrogenase complex n=1 Tax=Candidatus Kentrum sp. FM TaxID=2126340 RepID=A0A450VUQ8_9GAMM|nr:MAG: pyruvate dehydrogenase E2 component (dihydrolipoamide acetyltransferase) [Candidatus Kentron sp. FM]VFJ60384.1 MAG: pyruvate dehydrogenase E2 component (dihydrolipoamide acetyltransferase) [Candidatus Kentron sp. FM]VFK08520.1 MAG: pyruvate dehydrogenase E2 component (dihydrolipoamide acetyltransferase) [Candidatus Kentron sp. FM]